MKTKLNKRLDELTAMLMEQMNGGGFWTGELSSSALGAAVAVAALHFYDREGNKNEINKGLEWLKNNINADGSYGDTPESPGNISTSLLAYAALNLYADNDGSVRETQGKIAGYLKKESIDIRSDQVSKAILAHYQKDYTFSVPILTMCALCGIPGDEGFKNIPQLPFELALMPQKFYRLLNLSVVSYAIPALIAVGIVIFKRKKSGMLMRWIRRGAEKKALRILHRSLPSSGGFLEAIPLTAFVSLSLISAGYKDHEVVEKGIGFLKRTQRGDGGWPIDIDLSTWVTSLSVKALRSKKDDILTNKQQQRLADHLKSVQNKQVHPFNGTPPGGWGWTNYTGSVPDCDDTPGAMLALMRLQEPEKVKNEILAGADWLMKIQNSDGGFPTFSKGWGKLPFDQSCADLTGHCVLALAAVLDNFGAAIETSFKKKIEKSLERAVLYLQKHQKPDGAWLPLWFGNQGTKNHGNPVYGTARVLTYLQDVSVPLPLENKLGGVLGEMIAKGTKFLESVQNRDGSWGGDKNVPGTIEETALAVSALLDHQNREACEKGFAWLDNHFSKNGLKAAPIGLYFASLWYDEKMYPLTMYLEAVTRWMEKTDQGLINR